MFFVLSIGSAPEQDQRCNTYQDNLFSEQHHNSFLPLFLLTPKGKDFFSLNYYSDFLRKGMGLPVQKARAWHVAMMCPFWPVTLMS
jgi:hypothetical protein